MKVKTILVSQPEQSGILLTLNFNKHKVKIDFRPFIHIEGVNAKRLDFKKLILIIILQINE
jgi:uroporphyrinogen-III synthase